MKTIAASRRTERPLVLLGLLVSVLLLAGCGSTPVAGSPTPTPVASRTVSTSNVSFREFSLPGSDLTGITAGPDGTAWFANGSHIGHITSQGVITLFPLTTTTHAYHLVQGPDGALWFTDLPGNKIGRITTSGDVIEFSRPTIGSTLGITAGPDGTLWFTESAVNKIGRITTSGAITEYTIPTADSLPA
ncbi:MAG TPA: hypothetical protein VKV20_04445 [Ktedonobacteraceae bacterium]|jgi:virginiamycin B lyase|nr:hypothetical protein [Ktedonobacteraceae bacterium]